jgi:hypothetical protein
MYYSVKGYINFTNPQKVLDAISRYQTLRVDAHIDGQQVHFETVLVDKAMRDDLANSVDTLVTQNGGYVTFSDCVQNADGSIGVCTMTDRFYNDATITNPGNISKK